MSCISHPLPRQLVFCPPDREQNHLLEIFVHTQKSSITRMARNPAASHRSPCVAKLVHRLKPICILYIVNFPPWDLGGTLARLLAACRAWVCRLEPKRSTPPVLALILGKWMLIRITEILQDLNHTYNWVVVSSPRGLVRSLKTVEHDRLVRSNKKSELKYHLYVGPFHKQTSWFYQHSFIGFVTTKLLPALDGWKHSVQTFTLPLFL